MPLINVTMNLLLSFKIFTYFLNMAKLGCFRKFFENRTGEWVHFLNCV